ncbi:MAG: CheB methylesterase domain-containing protein [Lachnospirales bacterium]
MSRKIILIGASTGGPNTVCEILKNFPKDIPPVVVCIHMPASFTKQLAERINNECNFVAKEAKTGDILKKGMLYLCRGGVQTRIIQTLQGFEFVVEDIGRIGGYLPSIDYTFSSISEVVNPRMLIGVLLTGMGTDGAKALKEMHDGGAFIITQDEESSVVYGMPKVAFDMGASDIQLDFREIGIYLHNKFM